MTPKRILALGLFLLCSASLNVFAHPKTDIVTLYNGDRITGEIKQLDGGILKLSTDSMGTISIEWQEIAKVESDYYYEIQHTNGTRYFGSIEKSKRPGQLSVDELGAPQEIEWLNVVRIRPIETKVIDRIDAYFSAGYSFSRANSLTQTSFNGTVSYENQKSRNRLDARTNLSDSDDNSSSSTKVEVDRAVWTERKNVFRALFTNFEQNDELDLEYRLGVGAGYGRYFLDTFNNRLAGIAGLQVITEDEKGGETDQNLEMVLSSRYEAWRFNTPELQLDFSLSLFPSLTESGRVRSSSDLTLRWELYEDLFWDITAYGSYDNQAEGDKGSDYGVTTGLGYDF